MHNVSSHSSYLLIVPKVATIMHCNTENNIEVFGRYNRDIGQNIFRCSDVFNHFILRFRISC